MASRLQKSGAAAALVVTLVSGFEGVRQSAYPDPATRGKPWTICYGETEGVKPGDRRTMQECKDGLRAGLERYASQMEACTQNVDKIPNGTYVAALSWTWNLGKNAYCSKIAPLLSTGQYATACARMKKYIYAGPITMPGLITRRNKEYALCRSDL